jgi:hypothetical protein
MASVMRSWPTISTGRSWMAVTVRAKPGG